MSRTLAIAWLAFVAGPAWAQGIEGPYVGFELGQLDYEESDFGVSFDDTTLFYKVYGGYRFNETWSVEAYYGQTSDLKWSDTISVPPFGNVDVK